MSAEKNSEKNRVIIFDTTLRDGEQCPGASMNIHEKMEVARQLARLNVDVIEAGFPIASPGDFEAVKAVAEQIKGPYIAGLARCINKDIERCAEAVAPAGRKSYIHTFLATSAIHRQFKLKKAKDEIVKQAVAAVKYARKFCDRVQFSPEDASRTEPDFLAEVCEAVIDAGATTVNIPDTVGYAVPIEFGRLIAYLVEHVKNIHRAIIHVHCHNDLGLAVANSLAAVRNGARGIECTINGLGERAGNCSLEEVVMGLKVRGDALGQAWTGVKTKELYRTSRLVSQMSGMVVQRNKAIVGANAFAHEAGIHQDGILKERTTYEIMRPEDVGISGSELVLGKHSGRHALFAHLARMGFQVAEDQKESVYNQFKELCDKKKYIYDDDLIAIMRERISEVPQIYTLDYFHVATGTSTVPTATVRLKKGDEIFQDSACGDGPVDATLKTIDRITGRPGALEDYSLQAVTRGEDAVGEVSVTVAFGKDMVSAKAASTDIVEASAKAYQNALNSHLFAEQAGKGPKKKAGAARRQGRQP
jgi:2-isopropylmalate synthase